MADMAVLKAIVSLYHAGEQKSVERYKTRVKVAEENKLFSSFQKNIIEFLGLNEQAQKFGSGSFDLKFYRQTKINGKAENYAMSTKQQPSRQLQILTRWRSTRAIRMKVTMMPIFSQKNWLLVSQ